MIRLGLRARFVLALLGLSTALGLYGVYAWQTNRTLQQQSLELAREALTRQSREVLADRAREVAELLAESLVNPLYYVDLQAIEQIARSARAQPDVAYVKVHNRDGLYVHDESAQPASYGEVMDDPLAAAALATTTSTVQWDSAHVDAAAPIYIGPDLLGGVRVGIELKRSQQMLKAQFAELELKMGAAQSAQARLIYLYAALALGMAAFTAWVVNYSLVRPIARLAQNVQAIERGDFNVEFHSRRADELGDLYGSFDRMARAVAEQQREIRRIAFEDALTGLPNRLQVRHLLDRYLREGPDRQPQFALYFIDLDDFKRINDTLGHDAGDQTLQEVARRMIQAVAQERALTTVARLGGDEFVVLFCGDCQRQLLEQLAVRILDALAKPLGLTVPTLAISASIGISVHPQHGRTSALLMRNADLAMYSAKLAGKNRYAIYTDPVEDSSTQSRALARDLRAAIGSAELDLAFQPIYSLSDGEVVGVEALARWRHPTQGLVTPAQFLPLAREQRLMVKLGEHLLDRAMQARIAFRRRELSWDLAFNLSIEELRASELEALLLAALGRHGVQAQDFQIEICDSPLIDPDGDVDLRIKRLRAAGFGFWLDDFGSGPSGISAIRRLRVDGIKLDTGLVADLVRHEDALALARGILAMANQLAIPVVAEGIETAEQLDLLLDAGCHYAQGYWLGPPMELAALFSHRLNPSARDLIAAHAARPPPRQQYRAP